MNTIIVQQVSKCPNPNINMASAKRPDFEKAIVNMDPMQVTDYLHKTLDFLQRNNSEIYFPSISPYVEAFLVNLVTDTRNLKSKSFKYEDRKLASEIIEVLDLCRDVFRWTHLYEHGNILVYKKIFCNKIKNKPAKPSSVIAHRLLQTIATQSTPNNPASHTPKPAHTIGEEAPESINHQPELTTGFKLRFLNKTLRFIKHETEFTLVFKEPYEQAEYIYHLIKDRDLDRDVGFGYKSLYAPLWDAMEEYGVNYEFEVTLGKANSSDIAVLTLEKVPKNKKSKSDQATKKGIPETIYDNAYGPKKEEASKNTPTKQQEPNKQNQSANQSSNNIPSEFPPLEFLSNISERFFRYAVVALTDFADDETRASVVFNQLSEEELAFVKRVKTFAESAKVREMFPPTFRDLLRRLNYSIKEATQTFKITTTVNEKDRSITLKKAPSFASPLPAPVAQQGVRTGARSKSLAAPKTRDRSISKDRLIQFQKGGRIPATGNAEANTVATAVQQQKRSRSKDGMSKRTAKLLEDLSTPLESDRGIRLMRLMGWEGGALGARGDGIMEPLMPAVDLPTRGGLGHVPPPKVPKTTKIPHIITRDRRLDFRLTFLRCIHDLLLHDDNQKEIHLKEPLVEYERSFIRSAVSSLNNRRLMVLTERENVLLCLVLGELAGRPGLEMRLEYSKDLRTVTLLKLTNQPAKVAKMCAPRPRPVINIADDDVDVLVTCGDVKSVMMRFDVTDMNVLPTQKAVRNRALRFIFLKKFAEALSCHCQSKIVFKFDFTLSKKLKTFMRTVVGSLNVGDRRHYGLQGGKEAQVYGDLRVLARGSTLALEPLPGSIFTVTRTPIVNDVCLDNAGPTLRNNNNDDTTDNRNPVVNVNDCNKHIDIDKDTKEENNVLDNNGNENKVPDNIVLENKVLEKNGLESNVLEYEGLESNILGNNGLVNNSQRVMEAIAKTISNIKDAISNIDFNRDDHSRNSNEKIINGTPIHAEGIAGNSINNGTGNIHVKDVNLINAEVDNYFLTENEKMEGVEVKIGTECDIAEPNVKKSDMTIESEVNNNGMTESDVKIKRDIPVLSDLDRDIQDLEMTILKADLDCVVKKETGSDCQLEMALSETNLNVSIVKEKYIDYLYTKRAHSGSLCSQELEPKKVKISTETDEYVVMITPKNLEEKMTEDLVKQVQSLMAYEIDKAGGFLPLLKCHGAQNGALTYSCHDEEDVAWIKNVIATAEIDVEVVSSNTCLDKKSRELLIKINSYIPFDATKLFRKFEIYNVGLDTKYWKVSFKHISTTFIMFIVCVDERSFKYISDENFSLYCGIDKAQFSIIF